MNMIYLQYDANAIRGLVFIIFMAAMAIKCICDCFIGWNEEAWDFRDIARHFFIRTIIVCIVYFIFM